MSNESSNSANPAVTVNPDDTSSPGFLRRHRLPLFLGFVAICLYATSILYILYGRGPIA